MTYESQPQPEGQAPNPQYPPAGQYAPVPVSPPGKTLGIVGLILAILLPLIGLILSIVAKVQSKKAGVPNGPATAGIIVGAVLTVVGIIVGIIAIIAAVALVNQCAGLESGIYELENGTLLTCNM